MKKTQDMIKRNPAFFVVVHKFNPSSYWLVREADPPDYTKHHTPKLIPSTPEVISGTTSEKKVLPETILSIKNGHTPNIGYKEIIKNIIIVYCVPRIYL